MEQQDFDLRDKKRFYFHATPLRRFVVLALGGLFRLFMKMEVTGLEHFPFDGPVIIAANHVTNFDVIPMQLSLPRPIFYMGKAELFKYPIVEAIFRNVGAFPVFRGEKDQWALRHASRILAAGETLGMFPEGTRSKGRGLGVAKTGSARLAIEAGCPIVPMAIIGSDKFFRTFPRRTRVQVHLLTPILPSAHDTPLSLTEHLMFTLAAALPPGMRGVYSDIPKGFEF